MYNYTVDRDSTSANRQSNRHNRVPRPSLVEIFGHCPGGGIGIERLHSRTTPGSVSVAVNEMVAIASYDGDHDSIIDKTAQYSTVDLSKEHDTGRDFDYIEVSNMLTDATLKKSLRYSPIFKSLHKFSEF